MTDRAKLDELYGAVVDMACKLLEQNGEFIPIGAVLDHDGQVQFVAVDDGDDRPQSQAVIQSLTEVFRAQAAQGTIAASAIALDATVRSPETGAGTDAIVTRIRAPGYTRDVATPYTIETKGFLRKTRTVSTGAASASEGDQDVFF